jgi:Folate-dependent phosphoribosylglycinamide formyltransferase PurN
LHISIDYAQKTLNIMSKKIAIFASGSGSNAENIVTYFDSNPEFEFPLIISNKIDAFVHERAKKLKIPSFTFSKNEFEDGILIVDLLKKYEIDGIVLAGFLLKVPKSILEAFPNKIINIHPALLPKYGGKGMYGDRVHTAVHAAGEKTSGITIHYVNENYDEGNIIFQAECELNSADTPHSIAEKVHNLEYEWFPKIVERVFI